MATTGPTITSKHTTEPKEQPGGWSKDDWAFHQAKLAARARMKKEEAAARAAREGKGTPLESVLGLPPGNYTTDDVIKASMPIARITPCEPEFQPGFTLFKIAPKQRMYLDLLESHGFTTKMPLQLAFLADSFPTDTFSNEYGESFLQKTTDVASSAAGEINQIMGTKKATDAMDKITKALEGTKTKSAGVNAVVGGIGSALDFTKSGLTGLGNMLANNTGGFGGMAKSGANLVDRMLAGARVDFPQVWKNSGFAPSYTMTVRLYNPSPGNLESTRRHIIGPICAIMLLGIPRTIDGSTYNWPFLHKIQAPGIYNLDPAFITNITVIKGGDQQSIGWNQRLAMVDVRIDFGSLYNSMIAGEKYESQSRPTLKNYLAALEEQEEVETGLMYKKSIDHNWPKYVQNNTADKNMAKVLSKQDPDPETTPDNRVASSKKNKALELALAAEGAAFELYAV